VALARAPSSGADSLILSGHSSTITWHIRNDPGKAGLQRWCLHHLPVSVACPAREKLQGGEACDKTQTSS